MSAKVAKLIRKQLRNVSQDAIETAFTSEAKDVLLAAIRKEVHARLDIIEKNVKDALEVLDGRQKDMQSYLVRALQQNTATPVDTVDALAATSPITE